MASPVAIKVDPDDRDRLRGTALRLGGDLQRPVSMSLALRWLNQLIAEPEHYAALLTLARADAGGSDA